MLDAVEAIESLEAKALRINRDYHDLDAADLLDRLITREMPGRIALVSSFGTESALLLAIAAEVDRSLPIFFIDTGKLFPETLQYRDELTDFLSLSDVRTIGPSTTAVADRDPSGELWHFDVDACCAMRKVEPLAKHTLGFEALISGRKRYHGALREFIPRVEYAKPHLKIDPLATWSQERVAAEFALRNLPQHPLKADGYPSVGCEPCTARVREGGSIREGRWANSIKSECGIHLVMASLDSSSL